MPGIILQTDQKVRGQCIDLLAQNIGEGHLRDICREHHGGHIHHGHDHLVGHGHQEEQHQMCIMEGTAG